MRWILDIITCSLVGMAFSPFVAALFAWIAGAGVAPWLVIFAPVWCAAFLFLAAQIIERFNLSE